ncbi:MAG: patatin family protein [Oscillospiraceae bacterium]|nr:patatin family protein [Oscillospiraceae bacterium]
MKTGLVLEGGGMRGLYTIGALDALMKEEVWVDYVIGVSAGACNGVSYVSRQKGRSLRVNTEYLGNRDYLSMRNYIKTGSMFGMKFLFDRIPNELIPFDYDAYEQNPCEFVTVVTDVAAGKPVYFDKSHTRRGERCRVLEASSSIPGFSPKVRYEGRDYLDGGTTDPIPVQKALDDGCERVIVVLTREREFVKKPEQLRTVYKRIFKNEPWMIGALDRRHQVYNREKQLCFQLEKEGKAMIIAPKKSLGLSRFEKDREKLMNAYALGMREIERRLPELKSFLAGE